MLFRSDDRLVWDAGFYLTRAMVVAIHWLALDVWDAGFAATFGNGTDVAQSTAVAFAI